MSKHFGDFAAVDDVSLQVPSGSLTALLGPSGSGKSTLVRIVAGLEWPDAGQILISEKDATGLSPQKRGVGFVFQHYAAFKHMTVHDNIAFGLKVRKRPKAQIGDRVEELLHLVQLEGLGKRYPSQLSGSQRQRMGLARVRAELREWLTRLHDVVHVTTVFVTHDQEEAMEVADQIAVMNRGRLEQVGTPRELYDRPANEFVMRFVGDANEVGGVLVRPHDIELLPEASNGATEAMIVRFTMLGRDARVELHDETGAELVAILTRDRFEELELWCGQTVWVRPKRERILAGRARYISPLRALEQRRDSLPDPDTERREPVAAVAAAELVEQRDDEPGTAHSEWMTERDCAPVDVHALLTEPELADHDQALRCKRLVQLDEVEIRNRDTGALEELADRGDRADAHDLGIDACNRRADERSERLGGQLACLVLARDDEGGGAVVDPGRVAGCDGPVLAEGCLETGERLGARVRAWMLVDLDLADGYELVAEASRLVRVRPALMRPQRERVLILT